MKLRVDRIEFYRLDMQTRFPFRYGIASMSRLPHLFVHADVEIDGQRCEGIAADGLPPKWFTKNPSTNFEEDDLPAMLRVIRHAADLAVEIGFQKSFFRWWQELYVAQQAWASEIDCPPLLASFGCSLMERAVLDAVCRQQETTLFQALRDDILEIRLDQIRPDLPPLTPAEILPAQPLNSVLLRHTVGLGDPLTDAEIQPGDRVDDGLPHSLVANIASYGLTHFKIKLCGNQQVDRERLRDLASLLNDHVGPKMRFTLDGNEQYETMAAFHECWQELRSIPNVRQMIDQSLLFVEQPVHRDTALGSTVQETLSDWHDAPPIIIDESDADLSSLPRALELGYSGTSHKNCKGVIKGVAALATIQQRSLPGRELILSAEDLGNVGPIALLQDLAVVATLGISHVERNGHHYFAGLSMFPQSIQQHIVADHPDLYAWHPAGFASLSPRSGSLQLASINQAPMGVQQRVDVSLFDPWLF